MGGKNMASERREDGPHSSAVTDSAPSPSETGQLSPEDLWRAEIKNWYPNLFSQTHCVPHVYITRVSYTTARFGGREVLVLNPLQDQPSAKAAPSGGSTGTAQAGGSSQKVHSGHSDQPNPAKESTSTVRSGGSDQLTHSGGSSQKVHSRHSNQPNPPEGSTGTVQSGSSDNPAKPGGDGQTGQSDDSDQTTLVGCPAHAGSAQTAESSKTHPTVPTEDESSDLQRTKRTKSGRRSRKRSITGQVIQGPCSSQTAQSEGSSPTANAGESNASTTEGRTVLTKFQKADMKDDFAQQHMLFCLQALGDSRRPEPTFIISNLKFRDFLVHTPSPPPLPEGEFDVITVNPNGGIGIGELKSVGYNISSLNRTEDQFRADVADKVEKGVAQLNKQKKTMEKMVRDSTPGVPIRTFLVLPYVSREQLLKAVEESADKKKNLPKKLRQCLGAKTSAEAVQLCICSDDVSDRQQPWDVQADVVAKLDAWFERRFGARPQSPVMSNDVYHDVIARLCGPATAIYVHCVSPPRLEVHTIPQAVSLVGERMAPQVGEGMAQIVLTPSQVDLLNAAPRLTLLTGPPGTGKTITVVLQALVWLKQGFDVHIVAQHIDSWAACYSVYHQLTKTLAADTGVSTCPPEAPLDTEASACTPGTPHVHLFDFFNRDEEVDTALKVLKAAVSDQSLRVVMDECDIPNPEHLSELVARYKRFFSTLMGSVSDLWLWGTLVRSDNLPDGFREWKLTEPLRCPPAVQKQVQLAVDFFSPACDQYSASVCPAPCQGPGVMWLEHSGPAHASQLLVQCRQCGVDVGKRLCELGVRTTGSTGGNSHGPPPLRYSDVVILARSAELKEDTGPDLATEATRDQSAQTCGFVAGLRSQNIPARVLHWKYYSGPASSADRKIAEDLATAATDVVTVTDPGWVTGLERKLVVLLAGRHEENYDQEVQWSDDRWAHLDRLYSMSRCTSQLIVVQYPGYPLKQI